MDVPERKPDGPERDVAVEHAVVIVDPAQRRCPEHERRHVQGAECTLQFVNLAAEPLLRTRLTGVAPATGLSSSVSATCAGTPYVGCDDPSGTQDGADISAVDDADASTRNETEWGLRLAS